MNTRRRTRTALTTTLALALAIPAAASAKGGTAGPAPTPNPVPCNYAADGLVDAGYTFSNMVGDAGCVTAVSTWAGTVRLYSVAVSTGWTWTSSSTTDGIKVVFTQTSTGYRAEARIEPGKTDIRG